MKCETCGEIVIPVEGITAIFRRKLWWHTSGRRSHAIQCESHRECCDFDFIDGRPELTEFPSEGMLIPDTILNGD